MSSIKEMCTELRALFVALLDVETGDGACALSLLDDMEHTYTQYPVTITPAEDSDQEVVEVEVTDLANHVADMNDMMLEMILELNKRVKILESK